MKSLFLLVSLVAVCACTPLSDSERPIRTQSDVDRYNATVTSEGDKLVCDRERVVGSNFPKFVCMTNNQRERLAQNTVEDLQRLRDSLPSGE